MPQDYAVLRNGTLWTPGEVFPSDYPGAIVVPAHPSNFGYQENGTPLVNSPQALFSHTPEEPPDDIEVTPYYFQRPNVGASTHYYHDNDGDVYQMVPDVVGAYANGRRGFSWAHLASEYPWIRPSYPINLLSLSTEIEGYASGIHKTITRRQFGSLLDWHRYKLREYNIPALRQYIMGHYMVANNRSDPGPELMKMLWRELVTGETSMEFVRHNAIASWFVNRTLRPGPDGIMQAASDFGLPPGAKAVALEVFLDSEGTIMFFDGDTPEDTMIGYAGRVSSKYGVVMPVFLSSEGTIRFRIKDKPVKIQILGCLGYWL